MRSPAAACRRSKRGCRSRPGRASRAGGSLRARSGSRSRSTAPGRLDVFDEGIAAAATMPKNPILVSVFLPGGADALSLLSPQADPLYRKLRPNLAVSGGTVVRRGRPPVLEPGARSDRAAARRGQGDRPAGGRVRPPRPVALHVTPFLGGRRDRLAAAHGLDGPLPRRGRLARQPAAGPVADRVARAGARDREGAGRRDRRPGPVRLLVARRLGPGRGPDARGDRHARQRRRATTPLRARRRR